MRGSKRLIEARHIAELGQQGYTILSEAVDQNDIAEFELQVSVLVSAQAAALGLEPEHSDPFIDLFSVGGAYTERLYRLMERMQVLHRMADRIAHNFEQDGFFEHFRMQVPLVWPDIRADLPIGDAILPVHQDYKSTQCRTAFRMWVPLRPADAHHGTLRVYPGSHATGPVAHAAWQHGTPAIAADVHRRFDSMDLEVQEGDAVLLNPLLYHASVPNRSDRTKFTLMVQVQDLATMIDPRDAGFDAFHEASSERAKAQSHTV